MSLNLKDIFLISVCDAILSCRFARNGDGNVLMELASW